MQVRGFPTIKIFRKGEEPEDYQGGRTRGDIIARALDLFSDNAPPPELVEVSAHLDSALLSRDGISFFLYTPVSRKFSVQIVNEDVVKKTCGDSQLCVIAVLPHILDTGEATHAGHNVSQICWFYTHVKKAAV